MRAPFMKIAERVITRPGPTEEETKAKELAERRQAWDRLGSAIGRRYKDCRFDTFDVYQEPAVATAQRSVLQTLKLYASKVGDRVRHGQNVVFYGPCGSGKDHLLSALMYEAVMAGVEVVWINGMRLFEKRRDAINSDTKERGLLSEFERPSVLAISDPVPPWGELEKGQAEFLLRLLDSRYRDQKPTWVTANIANKADGEKRLSKHVWDRLRDRSVGVDCNWPSYRTPMNADDLL
jgi:DNA replication protein DnaC